MDLVPIFLISLGRTGSTLAMRLLASHPGIVAVLDYPAEVRFAQYCLRLYLRDREMSSESVVQPELFRQTQAVYHSLSKSFIQADQDSVLACSRNRISGFYYHAANNSGKPDAFAFLEKCLFDPGFLRECRLAFPDLKQILLVRDPRDMLCSVMAFNRKRGTFSFLQAEEDSDLDLVDRYAPILNRIVAWWQVESKHSFVIRYENLVRDQENELLRLFGNLEMEIDPRTLEQFLLRTQEAESKNASHMTSKSVSDSIGRWKKELSPEAKQKSLIQFESFLKCFDYV
jgi:hypothetical protein